MTDESVMSICECIKWLESISSKMSTIGEDYFDVKRKEAVECAILNLKILNELKEAYESDYQIQDLIEVCVEYFG